MKTGALIGGILGLCVGVGSLIFSFPQFLTYIFLGRVYEVVLTALPLTADVREGLGWLYFVFSTLVGVVYGLIVASLIRRLQK